MKRQVSKNKTPHLPICEDFSSSFCTYFYFNQSDAGRSRKSNYTPTQRADIVDDKMLNDPKPEDFESLFIHTVKRNSPDCEGISDQCCIYFYPDRPDADRSIIKDHANQTVNHDNNHGAGKQKTIASSQTLLPICEDTSSFCTYLHPDRRPDTGRIGKVTQDQTSIINETNGISQQQTIDSNQSLHIIKPACKDSSSVFTYTFANSNAFYEKKSNYTPTIATSNDTMLNTTSNKVINISVSAAYFTNKPGASTSLSDRPNSPSFSAVPLSLESPKSTTSTAVTHTSNDKYLRKLCNHQNLDVRIRNTKTKEFFYAAADYLALDKRRRRVFTWKNLYDIPGISDEWNGEEIWRFEPVDQISFNSFRLRNTKPSFGPKEYLFASKTDNGVYVSRGLPDDDYAVLKLGSSAKWQLLAKLADNPELSKDFCDIDMSKINGWVLRNEMNAEYLETKADDAIKVILDPTGVRRNVGLSTENFTFWDILPLSSYHPIPATPRQWKNGSEGTSKWDINCDFKDNIADFLITPSELECMDQCKRNDKCTHWTYNTPQRKCYLKNADNTTEIYYFESKCGFIPGRSSQRY